METVWLNALISTLVVSLISLIGILFIMLKSSQLQRFLLVLVSFSVGAMLGNAFFHLIPESYFHIDSPKLTSWLIIAGFMAFFVIEQLLHTHHSPNNENNESVKPYGYLSLYADAIHNFVDGILIGAAWLFSPEVGIATTISVILHEVPQEISDFGILLKAGFTKKRALINNFIVATTAILGTLLALWFGHEVAHFSEYILPIAAGGFIYLAASSLLPEVLRNTTKRNWYINYGVVIIGLVLMYYFMLHGGHQH